MAAAVPQQAGHAAPNTQHAHVKKLQVFTRADLPGGSAHLVCVPPQRPCNQTP